MIIYGMFWSIIIINICNGIDKPHIDGSDSAKNNNLSLVVNWWDIDYNVSVKFQFNTCCCYINAIESTTYTSYAIIHCNLGSLTADPKIKLLMKIGFSGLDRKFRLNKVQVVWAKYTHINTLWITKMQLMRAGARLQHRPKKCSNQNWFDKMKIS